MTQISFKKIQIHILISVEKPVQVTMSFWEKTLFSSTIRKKKNSSN